MLYLCVALVVLYWSVSLALFYWPKFLHTKQKASFLTSIKCISHRGGAGIRPENTMTAFKHSVELGCDMIELDVQLTKDGQVVVYHDDDLKRVHGELDKRIEEMLHADLPSKHQEQVVSNFPEQTNQTFLTTNYDTRIPTLEEVLKTLPPHVSLWLDMKGPNPNIVDQVHFLVKRYKRQDNVLWGSLEHAIADRAAQYDKGILVYTSFRKMFLIYFAYFTGLISFMPIRENVLVIPVLSPNHIKYFLQEDSVNWKVKLATRFLHAFIVQPRLFAHLNKRGVLVYSFVQNNIKQFHYCHQNGINACVTDFPNALISFHNTYERRKLVLGTTSDKYSPLEL